MEATKAIYKSILAGRANHIQKRRRRISRGQELIRLLVHAVMGTSRWESRASKLAEKPQHLDVPNHARVWESPGAQQCSEGDGNNTPRELILLSHTHWV